MAADSSSDVFDRFSEASVLVIGDLMLDEYFWGNATRISPEAPVPVVDFRRRSQVPGGAANVAANIAKLGGQCCVVGVTGRDTEGQSLTKEAEVRGIRMDLLELDNRPTTLKTRIIADGQQVVRVDREDTEPLSEDESAALLERAMGKIDEFDCMLLSDYGKGVVTTTVAETLIAAGRAAGKPVVVDPKGRDYRKYKGATVVTPNVREVQLAVSLILDASLEPPEAGRQLSEILDGSAVLMTEGARGMTLFGPSAEPMHIPAALRKVFDVTGAGDTVVATMALVLAGGGSIEQAAVIANAAAGIVVGKIGTSTVDLDELRAAGLEFGAGD